jgi:hypothetical protein
MYKRKAGDYIKIKQQFLKTMFDEIKLLWNWINYI